MRIVLAAFGVALLFALVAACGAQIQANPSTTCGSERVDLKQDSHNCGSCGNDCGGGGCVDGTCQRTVQLATGGLALTVSADDLVWTDSTADGGAVYRCAKSGCGGKPTAVTQTSVSDVFGSVAESSIAVTPTTVFWTGTGHSGSAFACPLAGCSAPTLFAAGPMPEGQAFQHIRTDGSNVFWGSDHGVLECATTGCSGAPRVFSPMSTPCNFLAVEGTDVFWVDIVMAPSFDISIVTCPLAGCTGAPRIVADRLVNPHAVAVDAANVYWVDGARVLACHRSGCDAASPVVLADAQANPRSIASDGTNVYWGNVGTSVGAVQPGGVMKCAVGGCSGAPTTIAESPQGARSIVVDAQSVFWIKLLDAGQTAVMRTAK